LEAVLALYEDPIAHDSIVPPAGIHPQVRSKGHLEIVLFCLGFPDQALAMSSAKIAEARRLAHPSTLALSLDNGARLLTLVGDNAALDERAGELIAVANRAGFSPLACGGNDLSRVGQSQKWRCDGGYISPAPRFSGLPGYRGACEYDPLHRPPGRGM
jgi:hypothetical protein